MAGSSKLCWAHKGAPLTVVASSRACRRDAVQSALPAIGSTSSSCQDMSMKAPGKAVGVQQHFRGPAAGQPPQAVGGGEHEHQNVLTPRGPPRDSTICPASTRPSALLGLGTMDTGLGSGSCEQLLHGDDVLLGSCDLCSTRCASSCEGPDCSCILAARHFTGAWCG